MKKGFTMMETLIALAILAIIGAVLTPIIVKILPDNDFALYKKSYTTLSQVTEELINDTTIYPAGYFGPSAQGNVTAAGFNEGSFMTNFRGKVNTVTNEGNTSFVLPDGSEWTMVSSTGARIDDCMEYNSVNTENDGNRNIIMNSGYAILRLDTNNRRGPNLPGEDRYFFGVCSNGRIFNPTEAAGGNAVAFERAERYLDRMRREAD